MFKFYTNILLFFFSFLISSSAISQSINGLKEVVSSQQEKIATIEVTLKKIIGSIENQSKNISQNQNIIVIENEINSINETIKILQNKINNITTLAYDLEFSVKRIERHIELSSINKQVNNENLKEKPNYKKNEQIEINKKSLDGKTNGVLGFIKEPANEDKQNKSLTEDKKVVNNDVYILPKGSVEDQFKFAEDVALSGDYSRAEKALNEFLITHKGHIKSADAQFMLARVYYNQDKYQEATFELVKFNDNYPTDPRYLKSTLLIAEAVVQMFYQKFATKNQACEILKISLEGTANQTEKFKTKLNNLINEMQCSTE